MSQILSLQDTKLIYFLLSLVTSLTSLTMMDQTQGLALEKQRCTHVLLKSIIFKFASAKLLVARSL